MVTLNKTFTQNGETLSLGEIIKEKMITAVKILSLTQNQKLCEAEIADPNGIELWYDGKHPAATLIFHKKELYERLSAQFDPVSLWIYKTASVHSPYLVHFHIDNIKGVTWN